MGLAMRHGVLLYEAMGLFSLGLFLASVSFFMRQHAAPWLLQHGLAYDDDLDQDLNGDGVTLLTAYALNLDPRENLSGSLPRPTLTVNELSLTFHALSSGVTYLAETSCDAQSWTTSGVTLTELSPTGQRTTSVSRSSDRRFLRLVFSQ